MTCMTLWELILIRTSFVSYHLTLFIICFSQFVITCVHQYKEGLVPYQAVFCVLLRCEADYDAVYNFAIV